MNNNPPLLSSTAHCYSCGKDLQPSHPQTKLQKHQYPVCNQKSDLVTLQKHYMCEICCYAFDSVKNFVIKHQLKWFNNDFQLTKIIDSSFLKMSNFESPFTKQNKRKSQLLQSTHLEQQSQEKQPTLSFQLNLPSDIYSAIISDNIQSQDLHHIHWLPKTVQYLIHLTSINKMRPQQRRQRVKKTLQALSYIYCVNQSDLKYLAILVQTLFCYMNEQALMKIIDRLLKGFMQNNVPMDLLLVDEVYEIDKSFEEKHLHKKPIEFRPDNLLEVIFSIFILLDFFKDGKLHRHISQLVHLSHQQLSSSLHSQTKTIANTFQQYLKSAISDHSSKLPKLSPGAWQQMIQVKRQKNHLSLIMKTIKKEQQENQEIIKEMENKFKKQKDQYINKIVKLNNIVEGLESQLKLVREGVRGSKLGKMGKDGSYQDEEVKSNPQMKTFAQTNKDLKNQPITERTEVPLSDTIENVDIKKHKSQVELQRTSYQQSSNEQTINYLKSILQVSDIIAFNHKLIKKTKQQSASFPLPQLPNTMKELSQVIITEINAIEKKVSSLQQQNKKLKEQSTRLLAILKRKQESWLPLLHEKDEIISLYEKALICLERGYVLPEEPLSSRIQAIVEKVSKVEIIRMEADNDDISVRDTTSVANSFVDDLPEELIPVEIMQKKVGTSSSQKNTPAKKQKQKKVRNSTTQKSVDNKIKKKTKKEKEKQTECIIF